MLYYLEGPDGLKGSRYLQVERAASMADLDVFLFLPTSKRILHVADDERDEGLLGSDFTYNDLRLTLPVVNGSYEYLGESTLQGRAVYVIERHQSVDEKSGAKWTRAVYYITVDRPFMLGCDYFLSSVESGSKPVKQMRVEKFRDEKGVRIAERMSMVSREGSETSITLQALRLNLGATSQIEFVPAKLATLDQSFDAGWPFEARGKR